MALAEAVLAQVVDLQSVVEDISESYAIENAAGDQLDNIAKSLGKTRTTGESDSDLRQYLLAKMALWKWDGSNEDISDALSAQSNVNVRDGLNGTVTVTPSGTDPDLVTLPAGVRVAT